MPCYMIAFKYNKWYREIRAPRTVAVPILPKPRAPSNAVSDTGCAWLRIRLRLAVFGGF